MSNSMTLDGVDLGGTNYRLVIESNDFVTPPAPRVNRDGLAMADGEAAQGASFGARTGTVRGVITAPTFTDLLACKENLQRVTWKTQAGEKVATFDAHPGKQYRVRVLDVAYANETPVSVDVTLTLYAPQPWAEATSATTVSGVSIASSPTTI